MIQIALSNKRPVNPKVDELQRKFVGYSADLSDAELYAANHGCWRLGARAGRERFVLFTYDGIVRQAVEIESIERVARDRRSVIHGEVLAAGHPVYDKYVGSDAPKPGARNPVGYFEDELDEIRCLCGCGESTVGRDFLPGHDQVAIHARVRQIGSVAEFLTWFDDVRQPRST